MGVIEWLSLAALIVSIGSLALTSIAMFVLWPMRHSAGQLREMAERLVAEKFAQMELKQISAQTNVSQQMASAQALVNQQMSQVEARLTAGHAHMSKLDERDHELRVEVLKAISELKDVVATKEDLAALRQEMKRG